MAAAPGNLVPAVLARLQRLDGQAIARLRYIVFIAYYVCKNCSKRLFFFYISRSVTHFCFYIVYCIDALAASDRYTAS